MKKKSIILLFLACILLQSFLLIQNSSIPHTQMLPLTNSKINTSYNDLLRNFTDTNDFLGWTDLSQNWTSFNHNSTKLDLYRMLEPSYEATCTAKRTLTTANTSSTIRSYKFHMRLTYEWTNVTIIWLFLNFTDNTAQCLFYNVYTTVLPHPHSWDYTIEGNIASDKIVNCLFLKMFQWRQYSWKSNEMRIQIFDESYIGRKVRPINPAYFPALFKVGEPVVFSSYLDYKPTDPITVSVTFLYQPTGLQSAPQKLQVDWTSNLFYSTSLHFNISGSYLFKITVVHTYFMCDAYTVNYQFKVYDQNALIYPADAKLTLWSPLGLILPTNLKVYLGDSETWELFMPQINKTLAFTPYAQNSSAHFLHLETGDNKLIIRSNKNGIKALIPTFQNLFPNLELYSSIVFDFRLKAYSPLNPSTLLIGLNYFQADYNLALNKAYLNNWVQYILPIPLFNWHNYSAALAQICFYSQNYLSYEIKNIYLANYENLTTAMTNAFNYTTQYEAGAKGYLSHIQAFTNQSYTSQIMWSNLTTTESHSYSTLTCQNNTGSSSTTQNITQNSTSVFSNSGNYLGLYSFTNDDDETPPDGWTCGENVLVKPALSDHKKVTKFEGIGYQLFDAGAQYTGTVEYWYQQTSSSTNYDSMGFYGAGGPIINLYYYNGYFAYYYGGFQNLEPCEPNIWYHIRVNWTSSGWAFILNEGTPHITLPFYAALPVSTSPYLNHDNPAELVNYLDAVDYSWADGYYLNRNMHQNQTYSGAYINTTYYHVFNVPYSHMNNLTLNLALTDSGYYPATYSFENNPDGSPPVDWNGGTVSNGFNGHSKIVTTLSSNQFYQVMDNVTAGIIDFFVYPLPSDFSLVTTGTTNGNGGNSIDCSWQFNSGAYEFYVRNYTTQIHLCDFTPNTWIHVCFNFSCATHSYQIYFNNSYAATIYTEYGYSADSVQLILFNGPSYLDAIDYSWASGHWNLMFTLQMFNYTSQQFKLITQNCPISNLTISKDFYNGTLIQIHLYINNTIHFWFNYSSIVTLNYFYYTNKSYFYYYMLPAASTYYFYNFSLFSTLQSQTSILFSYRTSTDNITFDAWGSSLLINTFKNRYLEYKIDCNTNYQFNYSQFLNATLYYNKRTILYHFLSNSYQIAFNSLSFLKNITLFANRLFNINALLNSSIKIYNFQTFLYQNISAINAFCLFNITSAYYNATKHVKLEIKINASQAFTFQFKQIELWLYAFKFNKTCYISANLSLSKVDFHLFYSTFQCPNNQSRIYLYLYDSTHLKYQFLLTGNTNLTTFLLLCNDPSIIHLKFKFIYYNAYLNNQSVYALITRYFSVDNQTYRLIDDKNTPPTRQSSDFLTFQHDLETICLTDYFGTVIYKQLINRTTNGYFIEIKLNFFTVTFQNLVPDSTVTFSIKNRGLTINITLDYGMSADIPLFTDDYLVVLYNTENKTVINIWDVTISAIKNRKFTYTLPIPIKPVGPEDPFLKFWRENWGYIVSPLVALIVALAARKHYAQKKVQPKPGKPIKSSGKKIRPESIKKPVKKLKRKKLELEKIIEED